MKAEALHAADSASVASAGLKGALAGGAALTWGGYTSNDIAMLGGLAVGVIGLIVQIYFKRREHQMRLAEHEMLRREHLTRMSELEP
jgi:hypothetical protein